ncbi:MAG TPA: LUD domain-containing protein [Gaiellaceae bacterium]|jgi:L-lactate dehydrogenase complex protein LldG
MVAFALTGREAMLARVRASLGAGGIVAPVPREYRRTGGRSPAERVALFCERVEDYRARVVRVGAGGVADAVAAVAAGLRLCVPDGVPDAWVPPVLTRVRDEALTAPELDRLDGVLTGCTVAIAETGTVVLTSAPDEGRRALTLVPDLHVVVVSEHSVVETVPEAIEAVARVVRDERRPVTFVSGPSATSDIELDRVEGVHGPRRLVVIVVADRVGSRP